MKNFIPSITIWKLTLTLKGYEDAPEYHYFLTRSAVNRFLKRHEEEIRKAGFTWGWGGVPLWLW